MQVGSAPEPSGFDTQTKASHYDAGRSRTCGQTDQRIEARRDVDARCELYFFDGPQATMTKVLGVALNVSFSGIAVVSDVPDAGRVGQAVEVVVMLPKPQPTHMAGTIAFCREIDFGKFEIGVHIQAAGHNPILIHDVKESRKQYGWFAESLQAPS